MAPAPKVAWKTLEQLESSLREFTRLYNLEKDTARRCDLRNAVIRAKDRARFASQNPKVTLVKREEKDEMVRWMLVWLDDPGMFAEWAALRRAHLHSGPGGA